MSVKNNKITAEYRFAKLVTDFLNDLVLDDKSKECFARRRFLRLLNDYVLDITAEQKDLRAKSCEKDAKGELKIQDGSYVFKTPTARREFNRAWEALGKATFTFDVLPSNEEDLKMVKKILEEENNRYYEDKKGKFKGQEYDKWFDLKEFIDLITL